MENSGLNGALYWIRTSDRRLRRAGTSSNCAILREFGRRVATKRTASGLIRTSRTDRFQDIGLFEIAGLMGVAR